MSRLELDDLKAHPLEELVRYAQTLRIGNAASMPRHKLVFEVMRARARDQDSVLGAGVLEILPDGFGFLRDPASDFLPSAGDIYVSPSQIRRFNLRTGQRVAGEVRVPKENERYFALIKVEQVDGLDPDHSASAPLFGNLTPIQPRDSFRLAHESAGPASRLLDLYAPLARGQRSLVLADPGAGRTALLRSIALGLAANHPSVHVFVLLVEERPEETTEMRSALAATRARVIASAFDEPPARQLQASDIVIERACRLAERGQDAVVLIDSLTRIARASNLAVPSTGRALPGGMDAAALLRPKRILASARCLAEGGSLSVVATLLRGTGARTDLDLAEALHGAANHVVVLDRGIAASGLRPGFDLTRTRNLLAGRPGFPPPVDLSPDLSPAELLAQALERLDRPVVPLPTSS